MSTSRKVMTQRLWHTMPCGLLLLLSLVTCVWSVDSQQGLPDNISGRDELGGPYSPQTDLQNDTILFNEEAADLLDVALSKVPEVCNTTLWQCLALNPQAMQALQAKLYCDIISNPAAKACFVTLGRCTERNYNDMKSIVCAGQQKSTAIPVSSTQVRLLQSAAPTTRAPQSTKQLNALVSETTTERLDLLDVAIAKVPEVCNSSLWQCLALNPQAQQAVQAKLYCDIFVNPAAKACLVILGKCTEDNFKDIKSVVCAGQQQSTPNSIATTSVSSTSLTTSMPVDLLDAAIVKVPEACNATLWQCLALNPQAQQAVQAKLYCDIMNNPAAKPCLVTLGKCTEDNFNAMKSVVCAGKQQPTSNSVASTKVPSTPSTTSTPVDLLDVAIAKVPEACNATLWQCLALNPQAQQVVEAKRYCDFMRTPGAKACLVILGKCTEGNFNNMIYIVCSGPHLTTSPTPTTAKMDLLESALSKVSSDCNETLWRCLNLNPQALDYLKEKQYCVVMANPQAKACLTVLGKCTQDEYATINDTVCENTATTTQPVDLLDVAIAKVPPACNQTLWQCVALNPQAGQAMQEKKYCDIMSNPAAKGCLVILGLCTEENFNDIKTTVCSGKQSTVAPPVVTTKVMDGQDPLAVALTKVSQACSSTLSTCLDLNSEAKQAVEEKRYCEVMRNPTAKSCMIILGNCKEEEFNTIQKTVCVVDLLHVALTKVSDACSTTMWTCMELNPDAKPYVAEKKYCELMSYPMAKSCLVVLGSCKEDEFNNFQKTVCEQPIRTNPPNPLS